MAVVRPQVLIAIRVLLKRPLFSLLIVSMLAIGIAGNTAVFSIVNGLLLRPLPVKNPERLVYLNESAPKWNLEETGVTFPDFAAWRKSSQSFEAMALFDSLDVNLTLPDGPERVSVARTTFDLLEALGIAPVLGRGFKSEEDLPGGAKVALLGNGLWKNRFGGRDDVLGEKLVLDGQPYEIVGVLPPNPLAQLNRCEMWLPLAEDPNGRRNSYYLEGIGRLKAGVTLPQVRDELLAIQRGTLESPEDELIVFPLVQPLKERLTVDFRLVSYVLLGAVGLVLLIGCVNVTSLMLARAESRQREMGIRVALGARRGSLMLQVLTESLLLAAVGAVVGALLAFALLKWSIVALGDRIPFWAHFELDPAALVFCLAVCVGAALLAGLAPAIRASRPNVQQALLESGTRSSLSVGGSRLLSGLVVTEIALALALLIGAGLLVEALLNVSRVDPGYRAEGVMTFRVSLPQSEYSDGQAQTAFFDTLVEKLAGLPGVETAAVADHPPLSGHSGVFFVAEGAPPRRPDEPTPVVLRRVVSPGYFETLGIHLISGRFLQEADKIGPVNVVVNKTFADQFWPGEDPIGKRISYRSSKPSWMTVVGLTADVKHYGLDREMRPGVYFVHREESSRSSMAVLLRTTLEPSSLVSPAREAVASMNPNLPLYQIGTMEGKLADSLWLREAYSYLFGAFAALALILALGGIYGVVSYVVSRRTHEIGIRMALGARTGHVVAMVLRRGMSLAIMGIAGGLGLAWLGGRTLGKLLFGVQPGDLAIYAQMTLLLALAALTANLAPAWIASRISPLKALRRD